jgi:membrane-associated phospholipid phosphatase
MPLFQWFAASMTIRLCGAAEPDIMCTAVDLSERMVPIFIKDGMNALRILRNVVLSSVVFFGALALALVPEVFDRPLTKLINGFANRSSLFDTLVGSAGDAFTFSGALLMAFIWSCWFGAKDLEVRARILVGTLASAGAGAISRFSPHAFSTHPRPRFDPSLGFQTPGGPLETYNTWDSFPSDHAAVFAGLVVVIYISRSRFANFAIVWTGVIESARVYMGAHYPSDLIGGAGLAAAAVWAAQASWPTSLGVKVMKWEQTSPSLFYLTAFFFSYQMATLFFDMRITLSSAISPFFHHTW